MVSIDKIRKSVGIIGESKIIEEMLTLHMIVLYQECKVTLLLMI